jgi:hypothetical protein
MVRRAPGDQAEVMSTRDPNSPPVPEPLTEYRRLPNLITILAIVVLLVLGVIAISLV